jgi:Lipid A 3-O-deacylase (PagL).
MDGTIAVVFLLTGFFDMRENHCPTGCLAPRDETPRLSFQVSDVEFQRDAIGGEVYLEYALPRARGPFQPVAALSMTTDDSAWIGYGIRGDVRFGQSNWYYEGALIPGWYTANSGPDLGGEIQFRSTYAISYEFDNDVRVGLFLDHRSNGELEERNPGLETYGLRVSIPLD